MSHKMWMGSLVVLLSFVLWGCGGQNQEPSAQFDVNPASPQAGGEVTLNAGGSSDPDGSISSYTWTLPDGTTLEGESVTHTFAAAGDYEVELTVADDKDATATTTRTITVAQAPSEDDTSSDANATEENRLTETDSSQDDTTSTTGTSTASTDGASAETAAAQLQEHIALSEGTTVRIPAGSEPRYLLPNATEGTWESQISGLIFDTLVETNDNMENIPAMAEGWEWNEQELSYTFHIREDIKWHDHEASGETVDCADVLFSFKAWTHPNYPGVRFSNFENVVGAQAFRAGESDEWPIPGVKCLDDHTFWVQLTQIQRTFLPYAIASSAIMPQHVYEPYLEENGYEMLQGADTDLGKTVGSGPYQLGEWEAAQYVKLERFNDYWRGRWGRQVEVEDQVAFPGIDQIYWVIMPDTDAQYAALLSGEVDVLDTRSQVDQYFQLENNPEFATYEYPQLVYDYWHWNLREEKFQDVQVRKAMCSAINRQQMVDQVLRGLGELTNGPSHPLRWDWDPALEEIHPHYDPERVVELMEEAGWTIEKDADGSIRQGAVWTKTTEDGETMTMTFEIAHNTPNPRRQDFAIIMQQQLSELGFKASVRPMETNAFYNDYLEGSHDFETAIAGWRMGTDPDGTSIWHSDSLSPNGFNWHAYSNPEVDRLLEEGLQYAQIEKAKPVYQELNRLLVDTMGYCWLAFPSATFASKPGLEGMEQWSPLSPYSHLTEWYWDGQGVPVSVMEGN